MNCETTEITADPATTELLRNGERSTRATEEIGDQVARIGRGGDNLGQECFGLLGRVAKRLHRIHLQVRESPDAGGSDSSLIVHPPALHDFVAPTRVINFIETNLSALLVLVEDDVMVKRPGRRIFRIEEDDIEVALPALFRVVKLAVVIDDNVLQAVFTKDLIH